MPMLQRMDRIETSIGSILTQTFSDWELHVVDSGSVDGCAEWVQGCQDPRIHLWRVPSGTTIAGSRNFAIAQARGRFLAFLDSDDRWLPHKLEVCVPLAEAGNLVYHPLAVETPRSSHAGVVGSRFEGTDLFRELLHGGNRIPNSSVVVPREHVLEVGCLDERILSGQDYDLWVRLARHGLPFRFVPDRLGFYWKDGRNTTTTSRRRGARSLAMIFDKYLPSFGQEEQSELASSLRRLVAISGLGQVDDARLFKWGLRDKVRVSMDVLPDMRRKDLPRWIYRSIRSFVGF